MDIIIKPRTTVTRLACRQVKDRSGKGSARSSARGPESPQCACAAFGFEPHIVVLHLDKRHWRLDVCLLRTWQNIGTLKLTRGNAPHVHSRTKKSGGKVQRHFPILHVVKRQVLGQMHASPVLDNSYLARTSASRLRRCLHSHLTVLAGPLLPNALMLFVPLVVRDGGRSVIAYSLD
jgi:hypothetical protein